MDKHKIIDFLFGEGGEKCLAWVARDGEIGSLLLNIANYGIHGDTERNCHPERCMDYLLNALGTKHKIGFTIKRRSQSWDMHRMSPISHRHDNPESGVYSWEDMHKESFWFMDFLHGISPKPFYVAKIEKKYGRSLRSVKKVSEIQQTIETWVGFREDPANPQSTYLRVKQGSKINIYEIFPGSWAKVKKDLDGIRLEYKIIDTSKYNFK